MFTYKHDCIDWLEWKLTLSGALGPFYTHCTIWLGDPYPGINTGQCCTSLNSHFIKGTSTITQRHFSSFFIHLYNNNVYYTRPPINTNGKRPRLSSTYICKHFDIMANWGRFVSRSGNLHPIINVDIEEFPFKSLHQMPRELLYRMPPCHIHWYTNKMRCGKVWPTDL